MKKEKKTWYDISDATGWDYKGEKGQPQRKKDVAFQKPDGWRKTTRCAN